MSEQVNRKSPYYDQLVQQQLSYLFFNWLTNLELI